MYLLRNAASSLISTTSSFNSCHFYFLVPRLYPHIIGAGQTTLIYKLSLLILSVSFQRRYILYSLALSIPIPYLCTLFFNSILQSPLLCTVHPIHLNSSSLFTSFMTESFPEYIKVLCLIPIFIPIPLVSGAVCLELLLEVITKNKVISDHVNSSLISAVNLSISIANMKGGVGVIQAHLKSACSSIVHQIAFVLHSLISCTNHTHLSATPVFLI